MYTETDNLRYNYELLNVRMQLYYFQTDKTQLQTPPIGILCWMYPSWNIAQQLADSGN